MEDQERAWRDLWNNLGTLTQAKESFHINVNQCLHMQSDILKLLKALRQEQRPAPQEFYSIAVRAVKLVEECSTEKWLLKAVEMGDCPEHFVELYLDLLWSLSLAGQEMISISEVYKVRDEDKRSLMWKVDEVLEGGHHNRNYRRHCQADKLLAAILKDRNQCESTPKMPPPPDLKEYVEGCKVNILSKILFQRVEGGSSFVVKYRWVYETEFVVKLALKSWVECDPIVREVEIMDKCRHPYVVGAVGCWGVKAIYFIIVMECMQCTLKKLIDKRTRMTTRYRGKFPASEAFDLMLPIAKALRYMHGKEKATAHRDIKPLNIMCSSREPGVAVPS